MLFLIKRVIVYNPFSLRNHGDGKYKIIFVNANTALVRTKMTNEELHQKHEKPPGSIQSVFRVFD